MKNIDSNSVNIVEKYWSILYTRCLYIVKDNACSW